MKLAVVNLQTNIVVNLIVVDLNEGAPPDGCFLVDVTDIWCDIGALYDWASGTFIDLNPPAPEELTLEGPAPEEPVV